MFVLFNTVILFLLFTVLFGYGLSASKSESIGLFTISGLLVGLIMLVSIIPTLGLAVRRLHNTGKSGWFYLIALIPFIGSIILFVFFCLDSAPGPNKYGPNPKEIAAPSGADHLLSD